MCGLKDSPLLYPENKHASHPLRMCGLKEPCHWRSRVWQDVTSFTDVWIESEKAKKSTPIARCHILYGCVD